MKAPSHQMLQFTFFCVLIYFTCIFHAVESATLRIVTEKEALLSFKSSISMEPPNPLSSWDRNLPVCNWTGVACNKPGDRVVGLDLSGFGLKGSISPHISNLSFLRSLQLQLNQFTGELPSQIGNLFRLRVLNMSFNSIEGVLPSNISKLTKLQILDLAENKNITGRVPEELSYLTKLEVLNLGKNRLYGSIPPAIGNLSSLTILSLGTNNFSGVIPSELGRLQNLEVLDLSINHLSGPVPPSVYNLSSLVSFILASNQLWGEIPGDIATKFPNLLVFTLCLNKFTGRIPWSLNNLTNIQIVRMSYNLLEGPMPPGLGNLPFLQMYIIGFNKIVGFGEDGLSFITSLTNSTRLKILSIQGNLLEGVIPESIGNFSKVLLKLSMGGNRIYGKIPSSIGHLSGLNLLNLADSSISGQIPPEIGRLEELQMLILGRNWISGSIPDSLGNFLKLNHMDLSGNTLVGKIPTTFSKFNNLLSIDLSNNRLNGSIPKEIFSLPSLSIVLNLSKNLLIGPLPQEIALLKSVVTIDLSYNQLSGNIPTLISHCKSLEKLFLVGNILSGPIPKTIGELKGLDTLDLSSNQLFGSIPAELQSLQALQLLNLSFNNLEGIVPSGGVFSDLSKVHLDGNPKLHFWINSPGHKRNVAKILIIVITLVILALCFILGLLFYSKKKTSKIMETSEILKGQYEIISFNDLHRATENFNQKNFLGKGSFGSVYKGYLSQGIVVAIKVLDTRRASSWKSFLSECKALRNVRHRNLVRLITSCSSIDLNNMEFLALVYEFLSNGSLDDWIKGKKKHSNGDALNFVDRLNVAIDVACALDYLHHDSEVPVVHCDLKPNNILLGEDMTAKIGDFGLASLLMERTGNQPCINSTHVLKGSIGYIPPEYGLGEKPSTAGDVYSFGILLLELFTGKYPTHESFTGGLNLTKWVQSAFPTKVVEILDPDLIPLMTSLYHDGQPVIPDAQYNCLITILGVGLSCTAESRDDRISIRSALNKLKSASDTLYKVAEFMDSAPMSDKLQWLSN